MGGLKRLTIIFKYYIMLAIQRFDIESVVFGATVEYVLTPNVIDKIAKTVDVYRFLTLFQIPLYLLSIKQKADRLLPIRFCLVAGVVNQTNRKGKISPL